MTPATYKFLADAIVVFHITFVGFVLFGAVLVLWKRRVMWAHLPAVTWGVLVEATGWLCPLTPLENRLRERGGGLAYQGGFVDHYIMPVLYPDGLTRGMQVGLACLIFAINVTCYGTLLYRHVRRRRAARRAAAGFPDVVPGPAVGGAPAEHAAPPATQGFAAVARDAS